MLLRQVKWLIVMGKKRATHVLHETWRPPHISVARWNAMIKQAQREMKDENQNQSESKSHQQCNTPR